MTKKDIVLTERIFKKISFPTWILWGIPFVVAAIAQFVWANAIQTDSYMIAAIAGGLLGYLGVMSPGYVYDKIKELTPTFSILLDLPDHKVDEWVNKNFIQPIFNARYMLLTGFVLPLFILPGALLGDWFNQYNQDIYIKIFDSVMGVVAGYFCSMSIFMYLPILNGFSNLGKQSIKTVSIFRLSEFATPISLTFAKFAFIVSMAYSLMLIIVISGPIVIGIPFYFYAGIGMVATIVAFVIPQLELNNIIRKAKWQILEKLSNEIEKSMERLEKDNSPENIKRVESLVDLHNKMGTLNEVSLTWETVSRLFGSAILPAIITLLEKLFRP